MTARPGLPSFDYVRATAFDEATRLLEEHGEAARLLMGGTDLFVRMRDGFISPQIVVDVKHLPGMRDILYDEQTGLTIGAAATMNEGRRPHVVETGKTRSCCHDAFGGEIPVRYDLHLDGLRYLEPIPPAAPIIIIHGHNDKTVPIEPARAYAADFPDSVRLIEVDADHDLNGHLELIWEQVQSFLIRNQVF